MFNEGKELKVFLKEKIEGYAQNVFNSARDEDTKLKVFYNKLTLLDSYFDETEYSKDWYVLAFQASVNGDELAKAFLGLN